MSYRKLTLTALMILGATVGFTAATVETKKENPTLKLPVSVFRDKMKAAWLGQMVGVSWGAPTEFQWQGAIIADDKMPAWHDGMANEAFGQDDLYVEMTFLRTLEKHGLKASIRQAGIDFANSAYPLWHANRAGREALRAGIAPPDSGHPKYNSHADDIDYQIEADFSGIVSPGMPNTAIKLGETYGALMNYGDGLYAGQFIGAMYSEAYFEKDPEKIVEKALKAIPKWSQYAICIRDVLNWYRENPDDWRATWNRVESKYDLDKDYRKGSCDKGKFNIDAKINGAYVVMGILYSKGDPDKSALIAMQCGQDSDCNPSNAMGVIATSIGYDNLPEKYKRGLDLKTKFNHTDYNFPELIAVSEKIARQALKAAGGKIVKGATGEEIYEIPVQEPKPSPFVQVWAPAPSVESKFTPSERKQIRLGTTMEEAVNRIAKGWKVSHLGEFMDFGYIEDWEGKKAVLGTHPESQTVPCSLTRTVAIPKGKKTSLQLTVGHYPKYDWQLVVLADGKVLLDTIVGPNTAKAGWLDVSVDLTAYAGKTVKLELQNKANDWAYEAGYWARIVLVSK